MPTKETLHRQVGRPTIPEADPWSADRLGRRTFAQALEQIIFSTQQPLVVCVNGAWGTGKTHLLEMWEKDLEQRQIACVDFNAWEFDYAEDPLVALVSQLEEGLSDHKKRSGAAKWTAGLKRIKDLGTRMLPALAPAIASTVVVAGTGGDLAVLAGPAAVATAEVTKRAKGLLTPSKLGLQKNAADRFENLRELRKLQSKFVKELEELAASLAKAESGPGLVVFVDDLDRCRPSFAIETLERLKHFFSVPRVAFVLAADRAQLGCALRATYGEGIDEENYLRRFFSLTVQLPTPSYRDYAEFLFEELSLSEVFEASAARVSLQGLGRDADAWMQRRGIGPGVAVDGPSLFKASLAGLSEALKLPLRAMDQAAELAALVARRYRHDQPVFAAALLPVVALAETVPIKLAGSAALLSDLFLAKDWGPHTLQETFSKLRRIEVDAALLAAAALTGRYDVARFHPPHEAKLLVQAPGGSQPDALLPLVVHFLQRAWAPARGVDSLQLLAARARELGRELLGAPKAEGIDTKE